MRRIRGPVGRCTDFARNPFHDSLIASGSDDGKVFLWRVPEDFTLSPDTAPDEIQDVSPVGRLAGHSKQVQQNTGREEQTH